MCADEKSVVRASLPDWPSAYLCCIGTVRLHVTFTVQTRVYVYGIVRLLAQDSL